MLSLTYLSHAVASWSDTEIAILLQRARTRNEQSAITGMLLYCGDTFVQTLEGPADEVDAMFTLIDADARHCDVFIARRGDIRSRGFTGWYMGYHKISHQEAYQTAGFTEYSRTGRIDGELVQMSAVASLHRVFHAHTA